MSQQHKYGININRRLPRLNSDTSLSLICPSLSTLTKALLSHSYRHVNSGHRPRSNYKHLVIIFHVNPTRKQSKAQLFFLNPIFNTFVTTKPFCCKNNVKSLNSVSWYPLRVILFLLSIPLGHFTSLQCIPFLYDRVPYVVFWSYYMIHTQRNLQQLSWSKLCVKFAS